MSYDRASAIMTNTYLDSADSEDGYYLFSEGMNERYGTQHNDIDSEMSGGTNEELSASNQSDAMAKADRNNFSGDQTAEETIDTDSQPTGGFPPIYIANKKTAEVKDATKARELSTRTSAVSIQDILKKKKVATNE
jgi:hypothetical protein